MNVGKVAATGTNTLNIVPLGSTLTPGTYPLITAPAGGLSGTFQFPSGTQSTTIAAGTNVYQLSLQNTATNVSVSVSSPQRVSPSLIGYYPMDDNSASSTVQDYSSNGYNGTLATISGTAVPTSNLSVPGKIGTAFNISGQARIDLSSMATTGPTGTLNGLTSFSVSIWYKNYTGGTNQEYFLWNGGTHLQLEMYGNDLSGYYSGICSLDAGQNVPALSSSSWQLFTVTFNDASSSPASTNRNTTISEYAVNGTGIFAQNVKTGFRSPADIQSMLTNFYIASGQTFSSSSLDGAVDDAAIWSNVLTANQALALYNFADNAALNYGAGTVANLFDVYNGSLASYTVGGLTWRLASGLSQTDGELVQNGNVYSIQLDDNGGGLTTAVAAGSIWTGASDTTWANAGNWTGAVPGATSGTTNADTATFNQSATNSPLAIDAGRNVMNITFDTAAVSSMTIGTTTGPALVLSGGGTIQTTSTVTNPQTVNAPLVLEGSYTFTSGSTTGSATLTFGGTIKPDSANSGLTTLTLNGANTGANTIAGVLADNGSAKLAVSKSDGGTWRLTGTNTFTGGIGVSGGTLRLAATTGTPAIGGGAAISGSGTLELAGSVSQLSQSVNVANSSSATAGLLVSSSTAQKVGTILGTGNVVVNTGASLTAYQIRQNSLTIAGTGKVTLSPSGSGSTSTPAAPNNTNFSSNVNSLTLGGTTDAWTGTLDIGNNALVIPYGAGTDPYTTIVNMVKSAYGTGTWNGAATGITSSLAAAAANSSAPLNIGLRDFKPGQNGDPTSLQFAGQTITTSAVLVRLTYMDDLILAGDMQQGNATSDALRFAANYGTGTTWSVGDLNHDGVINTGDALIFAANYVVGLPSLDGTTGNAAALGSQAAAVPEPASILLIGLGTLGTALIMCRRGIAFC